MSDPYKLQRFVDAQAPVFEQVVKELGNGRKTSHWMWFIFPQIKGLGRSPTATYFAISSLEEAKAYLNHPVLGPRLRLCTELVNRIEGQSVDKIFGFPDNMKFRSSMTLFAHASAGNDVFAAALQRYFSGEFDPATTQKMRQVD